MARSNWCAKIELVKSIDPDQLAEEAVESWSTLAFALTSKGPYPKAQFYAFAEGVRRYLVAIEGSPTVHRNVAGVLNGLREYLELERKRVPGEILYEADRLECQFFDGYDPQFEGDEPPGL